ncbi:MAG TPA: hypothetical protein VLL49_08205, partial [Anaerolineales bacterium]|nr:hypothetical protein [Anaerolineales bacterium]
IWTAGGLMTAVLLSGSALVVGAGLTEVTDYPFSLGWSEGNRLWDYSLLFGTRLYSFDPGVPPVAYLDTGRQLVGGVPFLLPGVTILAARIWLALVATLSYLLLGLLAFWPRRVTSPQTWILGALLVLVFLNQGPIHAPLVISAILVVLGTRASILWGALLMIGAGYFAATSRFTWMFAPAIWAVMIELGAIGPGRDDQPNHGRRRAIVLGLSGLLGSALAYSGVVVWSGAGVESSAVVSTSQQLLWYRLLPNATYGQGIVLGLARAVVPLAVVLVYAAKHYWRPPRLQAVVLILALLAFLVVGLIVSAKIGGGGDLHNLDMFLIGMVFAAAVLWRASEQGWRQGRRILPWWTQLCLALAVTLPAYGPLLALRPISFAEDAEWLRVLVDAERARDLGSLPGTETVAASLDEIQRTVAEAQRVGPILFLDQRQLMTFGHVRNVQLVSEYEKKRLMDEALSGNRSYFDPFYRDLAAKRFALLVSSPLRTPIKDREYGFGEENNAWVEWVARPVLCYYEELDTLNEVKVQLLVPREDAVDCPSVLPRTRP